MPRDEAHVEFDLLQGFLRFNEANIEFDSKPNLRQFINKLEALL